MTPLYGSLFCVSFTFCLLSLVILFCLKLHFIFLYRLAAYQVFASLLHAFFGICQLSFLTDRGPIPSSPSCEVIGYLFEVAAWMKLLISAWLTFHIFCFAVFYKNLRKLETLYISTSILIPIVISSIPLMTKSYGPSGAWCWILHTDVTGFIEQIVLWFVPQCILLFLESAAMLIMLTIVYRRAHRGNEENLLFGREQNQKAFRQLQPLVVYPITFFVLSIPTFVYRAYQPLGASPCGIGVLQLITIVCVPSWGITAGVTLMLHIAVVKIDCVKFLRRYYSI